MDINVERNGLDLKMWRWRQSKTEANYNGCRSCVSRICSFDMFLKWKPIYSKNGSVYFIFNRVRFSKLIEADVEVICCIKRKNGNRNNKATRGSFCSMVYKDLN